MVALRVGRYRLVATGRLGGLEASLAERVFQPLAHQRAAPDKHGDW
jgi:hypothetical protein